MPRPSSAETGADWLLWIHPAYDGIAGEAPSLDPPLTRERLDAAAAETGYTRGKWLATPAADRVDAAWDAAKTVCEAYDLPAAKVSTARRAARYGSHLVCVYTRDYRDEDRVATVGRALDDADLALDGYKPDIYTVHGVDADSLPAGMDSPYRYRLEDGALVDA